MGTKTETFTISKKPFEKHIFINGTKYIPEDNEQMKISKENIIKLDKKETTVRELFPEVFVVDYNEPLLSLNDLLSVWGNPNEIEMYKNNPLFKNFERVAEQKLNNK